MMNIRNPKWTATGMIDCEIDHPQYGWIPFTAAPDDTEANGREIFVMAEAMGPREYVPPPVYQDPKLTGVEFNGTMCSATAEDQHGLAAVLVAIQFQGAAFQPTRFHFSNGNTLVISLDNWQDFAAVWLPFRQSFFAVEA